MDRFEASFELTSSETANLLAVHPSTVKRWCNEGDLTSEVTPGGHRRIPIDAAVTFAQDKGIRTVLTPFHPYEPHVWTALRGVEERDSFDALHELGLQWARRGEFERLEQLFLALGRGESLSFCAFCDRGLRGLLQRVGQYNTCRLEAEDFERRLFEWAYPSIASARRQEGRPYPGLTEGGEIIRDW